MKLSRIAFVVARGLMLITGDSSQSWRFGNPSQKKQYKV